MYSVVFATYVAKKGEQGWRSGESARLPPICPGLDSRTRRHMWVEFVVGPTPLLQYLPPWLLISLLLVSWEKAAFPLPLR